MNSRSLQGRWQKAKGTSNSESNAKILKEWGNLPSQIRDDINKRVAYTFTAYGSRVRT